MLSTAHPPRIASARLSDTAATPREDNQPVRLASTCSLNNPELFLKTSNKNMNDTSSDEEEERETEQQQISVEAIKEPAKKKDPFEAIFDDLFEPEAKNSKDLVPPDASNTTDVQDDSSSTPDVQAEAFNTLDVQESPGLLEKARQNAKKVTQYADSTDGYLVTPVFEDQHKKNKKLAEVKGVAVAAPKPPMRSSIESYWRPSENEVQCNNNFKGKYFIVDQKSTGQANSVKVVDLTASLAKTHKSFNFTGPRGVVESSFPHKKCLTVAPHSPGELVELEMELEPEADIASKILFNPINKNWKEFAKKYKGDWRIWKNLVMLEANNQNGKETFFFLQLNILKSATCKDKKLKSVYKHILEEKEEGNKTLLVDVTPVMNIIKESINENMTSTMFENMRVAVKAVTSKGRKQFYASAYSKLLVVTHVVNPLPAAAPAPATTSSSLCLTSPSSDSNVTAVVRQKVQGISSKRKHSSLGANSVDEDEDEGDDEEEELDVRQWVARTDPTIKKLKGNKWSIVFYSKNIEMCKTSNSVTFEGEFLD